jgi:hypothetical protein
MRWFAQSCCQQRRRSCPSPLKLMQQSIDETLSWRESQLKINGDVSISAPRLPVRYGWAK